MSVLRATLIASSACALPIFPDVALAACPLVVGTTTTCVFGDTVDPLYETPATIELILQGGVAPVNTLLFNAPLLLRNLLTPVDLILTTSNHVSGSGASTPFLVRVQNTAGRNTLSFSADTALTGTDLTWGIRSESNDADSNLASRIDFAGQLSIVNTVAGPVYGIRNEVLGGADAQIQLAASGQLSVDGPGAYGMFANSFLDGDAYVGNAGDVFVRGTAASAAHSALYALSDAAGAGISSQGQVTFDTGLTGAASTPSYALRTTVNSGTDYSIMYLGAGIDTFGNGGGGIWAQNLGAGPTEVNADAGNYIHTRGNDATGLRATSNGGSTTIRSSIVTTDGNNSPGIVGASTLGTVTLENVVGQVMTLGDNSPGIVAQAATGISLSPTKVATEGDDSNAIDATITQSGPVTITTSSYDITTLGDRSKGILVNSPAGTVNVATSLVETTGTDAAAITVTAAGSTNVSSDFQVLTHGAGSKGIVVAAPGAAVTITTAHVETQGANAAAITGTVAGGGTFNVTNTTGILTTGAGSTGVALTQSGGTASITSNQIRTTGLASFGVDATMSAAASLNVAGPVVTTGNDSTAVRLVTAGAGLHDLQVAAITTSGTGADALLATAPDGTLHAVTHGAIAATGVDSRGIAATSTTGVLDLDIERNVQTTGRVSSAVTAIAADARAEIGVLATSGILGGWEATLGQVSARTGYGAAGVILGGGATAGALLDNSGTIGAWSDRAVLTTGTGAVQIDNRGTLTGYLKLGAGADQLTNLAGGLWDIRHFADTDGNAARDTKRVAQVEFGAGIDVVKNEATATIRSANFFAGATDTGYQYAPAGLVAGFYSTATAGVEQIQLLQLERFEHRGLISLADADSGSAATAGDIFLMTSGTIDAAGVLTAGAGPAVFVSDGGSLRLDTVLDAGGPASRSDMLVTDAVALGPLGATNILITNAGGFGAATTGDGIKLVDVLGGAPLSAPSAFRLGAPVMAGAFQYNLYRSGVATDDGDWYLRTQLPVTPPGPPTVPTVPTPPTVPPGTPNPPPTPPVAPTPITPTTYRPEAPLLAAVPNMLRGLDASAIATHHRRVGDESSAGIDNTRRFGRSWARVLSEDIGDVQEGTVAPSSSGRVRGMQLGTELLDNGLLPGGLPSLGLYAGRLTGDGAVKGFANGVPNLDVGTVDPTSTFVGLYGTRRGKNGFYFDLVAQRSWYTGKIASIAGVEADVKGSGLLASLEFGKGIRLFQRWTLEPQIQILAQSQTFEDLDIPNATVSQNTVIAATARAGLRFSGRFNVWGGRLQPYLRANAWKSLPVDDETTFSAGGGYTTLVTSTEDLLGEGGVGLNWAVNRWVMVYAEGSTFFDLDKQDGAVSTPNATNLSLGLRVSW